MIATLPALLLPWFAEHYRQLPWRRDKEPYHVWLSEIMLQQTRVEAVKGYYERFLRELPTVEDLAVASEDKLLKLWEGLGYYSRVRNLQKAACQIREQGQFPQCYEELLKLPGVGPYTAGAIASICFEEPVPAVDGNVIRVLSRYLARTVSLKEAGKLLKPIYPQGACGDFTQALMELGATVCLPNRMPNCETCPLRQACEARRQEKQLYYPEKEKKKPRRVEERTVFLLRWEDRLAVTKRPKKGLLAGLWQFPDVEGRMDPGEAIAQVEAWGLKPQNIEKVLHRQHIFTHVQWELTGVLLQCGAGGDKLDWFTREELEDKVGLPSAYRQFLEHI